MHPHGYHISTSKGLPRRSLIAVHVFLLIVLTIVVGNVSVSLAQGTISGRITDEASSETLIGVNVIVVGTTAGAATDIDGRYSISGLKAGAYSVRVSYLGFETKLFTGIEVRDGETTTLDF